MDPIYRKCLLALEKINEHFLPLMGQTYKQFMQEAKDTIINHQCLNESRKFSTAAIEALNTQRIENSNVKQYLNYLQDIDDKIDQQSRYLNDLLKSIQDRYVQKSKKYAEHNHRYLNEIKHGETPAEELLQKIVVLGKDIQKTIGEEIPEFAKELDMYMTKAEDQICDAAYKYYNKVLSLDPGTFPDVRVREWTYLPGDLFRTAGAFVHTDYNGI